MPPMPPPAGMPPPPAFFFGTSATMASVVISSAATEAAFWIATRTTLVGSMMPLEIRLTYSPIDRDLAGRRGERLAHDRDAGLLIIVLGAQSLEMLGGTQQSDAAARHDAFFNRRTGRMHRVIHAILALPYLDLGRAADADHRDAARELGQTLLQFLTVVVRGGFLDLSLDLGN